MATLFTTADGRRVIQLAPNFGRKTIGLGHVSERHAQAIFAQVENLVSAKYSAQAIPLPTLKWSERIDPHLHAKLVRAGLLQEHKSVNMPLGKFMADYISRRTDLKPSSIENLKQTQRSILDFFVPDRALASITKSEARDWQRQITKAQATSALYVKKARQFFADAVERRLIDENPFKVLKPGTQANPDRMRYVSVEDIERVIERAPDAEWRLMFALARYAGLRVPSETRNMRWADVDLALGKLTVRSPKTEHHEGKASRTIPIFAPLIPLFVDLLNAQGASFEDRVFQNQSTFNPHRMGTKIVKRAGLTPWPKLFQNLRSSCETDLTAKVPLHVACAWIGNSQTIAMRHYLQVTPEHFDMARAAFSRAGSGSVSEGRPEISSAVHADQFPRGTRPRKIIADRLRENEIALLARCNRARRALSRYRVRAIRLLQSRVRAARGGRT